jgi:hypothetical protein
MVQSGTQVSSFWSNILLLASGQWSKPNKKKKSRNMEQKTWTTSMGGLKGNVRGEE